MHGLQRSASDNAAHAAALHHEAHLEAVPAPPRPAAVAHARPHYLHRRVICLRRCQPLHIQSCVCAPCSQVSGEPDMFAAQRVGAHKRMN